jgi:hypothetical protein
MNNRQVAEAWASRSKTHGTGSHFYFTGTHLYSYGSHFIVGVHTVNDRGESAILVTEETYSNSTRRHVSLASYAASDTGLPVFPVPKLTNHGAMTHEELRTLTADAYAMLLEQADDADGRARRARTESSRERAERDARTLRAKALELAQFFGLPRAC